MIALSIFDGAKPRDSADIGFIDRLAWAYIYMLSRHRGIRGGPSIPGGVEIRLNTPNPEPYQSNLSGFRRGGRR